MFKTSMLSSSSKDVALEPRVMLSVSNFDPGKVKNKVYVVDKTIVVDGSTFDGRGITFKGGKVGDGSQSESQKPLFKLMNGATLKNAKLIGADGVHTYGNVKLQKVDWLDVGEDALTIKKNGNVTISGGSASKASDKIFQVNAKNASLKISNFKANGFQTFVRTNGGKKDFKFSLTLSNVTAKNGTVMYRTDTKNTKYSFKNVKTSGVKYLTRVGNVKKPA